MNSQVTAMKRIGPTLTPELAGFIDSFSRLALELPGRMAAAGIEIEETEARMRELARQGMIRAAQHWRTSRRNVRYLTLVFSADASGKCSRKYIGKDPVKVQEALDALHRAVEYDRFNKRLQRLMEGLFAGACDIFAASRRLASVRY